MAMLHHAGLSHGFWQLAVDTADATERARNPLHKTRVQETEGWHMGSDGVEGCTQEMNEQ